MTVAIPTANTFDNLNLQRVSWFAFQVQYGLARINDQRIADATSPFEVDPTGETSYWLAADGMSGFAINYHGETQSGELCYVFSRVKGRGDSIVRAAIDRGATRLDCFDGYLVDFYSRHGFVESVRVPNWTPGGPDVVYMSRGE